MQFKYIFFIFLIFPCVSFGANDSNIEQQQFINESTVMIYTKESKEISERFLSLDSKIEKMKQNPNLKGIKNYLIKKGFELANWGFKNFLRGVYYELVCHGTLVAPNLVLTAGHCLIDLVEKNRTHEITVAYFDPNTQSLKTEDIEYAEVHPEFSKGLPILESGLFRNDFGIIKLKKSLSNSYVNLNKEPMKRGLNFRYSCFTQDWRTGIDYLTGDLNIENLEQNRLNYIVPTKKNLPLGSAQSQQILDFVFFQTIAVKSLASTILSTSDVEASYTEDRIVSGYSGGPIWCVHPDEGIFLRSVVATSSIAIFEAVASTLVSEPIIRWINSHL